MDRRSALGSSRPRGLISRKASPAGVSPARDLGCWGPHLPGTHQSGRDVLTCWESHLLGTWLLEISFTWDFAYRHYAARRLALGPYLPGASPPGGPHLRGTSALGDLTYWDLKPNTDPTGTHLRGAPPAGVSPAAPLTHQDTQPGELALGSRSRVCSICVWLSLLLLTASGVCRRAILEPFSRWECSEENRCLLPSCRAAARTPGRLCLPGHTWQRLGRLVVGTPGEGLRASGGWGPGTLFNSPQAQECPPNQEQDIGLGADVKRWKKPGGQVPPWVGSGDQAVRGSVGGWDKCRGRTGTALRRRGRGEQCGAEHLKPRECVWQVLTTGGLGERPLGVAQCLTPCDFCT